MPAESLPQFSVVVPFFNEEALAAGVVEELVVSLDRLNLSWEAILVDDGSTDRTAEVLTLATAPHSNCRILRLRPNRGQGAALFQGFRTARAPILGMMDGDGQNVPDDFRHLLSRLFPPPGLPHANGLSHGNDAGDGRPSPGVDFVNGVRADRHDSALRKKLSRLANTIRGGLLKDTLTDAGCAIKVFRREIAETFWPFPMLNPFMGALAASAGFHVAELAVRHRPRTAGTSNYGLGAVWWKPSIDLLAIWWLLRRRVGQNRR